MSSAWTASLISSLTGIILVTTILRLSGFSTSVGFLLVGFAGVIAIGEALFSVTSNYFRARQQSLHYGLSLVSYRYLYLIVVGGAVFLGRSGLNEVLFSRMVAVFAVIIFITWVMVRQGNLSIKELDYGVLSKMCRYGFPLALTGIATSLLNAGDRYVIRLFEDSLLVGMYAASHNVARMTFLFVSAPLSMLLVPAYSEIWAEKGKAAASRFLSKGLEVCMYVFLPLAAGLIAISRDLIVVLAGDAYLPGIGVIPWVTGAMMLIGIQHFTNAGLYISKKTHYLMYALFGAAGLNIVLNLVFVPLFGITGAAITTLISCGAQMIVVTWLGRKYVPVNISWRTILHSGILSGLMFILIKWIHVSSILIVDVVIRVAIAMIVYVAILLLFVPSARKAFNLVIDGMRFRGSNKKTEV
jgi:O-antigen/teichoic acid export membrane protein